MINNTFGREIIPKNDAARISALHRYEIIDTPPEDSFEKIARLAQSIFNTPIALVALVDREAVFFKVNVGMGTTRMVERGISLCSLAVADEKLVVFEDASKDPCLLHNPLVAGAFGLRFYAGAPITTHDGYAVGTVCIVDHSPRTFSQEQRNMLQQLADLVMNELELRLAARKALGAQTELLHTTIHDLKNPLNNINGLANLIEMAEDTESVLAYARLIKKSTSTLNGVVQNLMDSTLSHPSEHGLRLENVDLAKILQLTVEENTASVLKKNQHISSQIGEAIEVFGDPLRLKIVLDNLISNAIKYSPQKSTIHISLFKQNGDARLEIQDQGQGITEQDQERIFGKYARLSAQPTDSEPSSGLGLYISKKIVDQHQGRIWAQSEGKNKGSLFVVELPRKV
jgi:signal transduction histidine kinase